MGTVLVIYHSDRMIFEPNWVPNWEFLGNDCGIIKGYGNQNSAMIKTWR